MKKVVLFLAAALMGMASSAQVTTFPWTENFDSRTIPSSFTTIDADNDGYNWDATYWASNNGNNGSAGLVASASFINQVGALTPDNWLILPAMTLPASASDFNLSWYDAAYGYAEPFTVYITTAGNTVADFTAATDVTTYNTNSGTMVYQKRTVSLASYAGQTVYIAFRHWNCTDNYWLLIDDIRVGGPELPVLSISGPASVGTGAPAVFTASTDASTLTWYVDGTQQSETGTTLNTSFATVGSHVVKASATNAVGTTADSVVVDVVSGTVNTFPWTEGFEGGVPVNFSLIDADGDGYNWALSNSTIHSGSYHITSASYANSTALTPDNWMILPAFELPATATDFVLRWWDDAQDPSYPNEYYSVYVATAGNTVADFTATTPLYSGVPAADYTKRSVSLGAYAGQTIYVAFRHYNCTDMFRLNIDDLRIGGPEPPEISVTGADFVSNGNTATYTATSDVNTFAWYVDGVAQSATGATFSTTLAAGMHVVKVSVTNAAGTSSDSVSTFVYTADQVQQRNTLLENFTTGQCQYCPGGHERINQAIANYSDRIVWVAHHVGYGTDNMTINESNEIARLYNTNSTWAPAMMLDRNANFSDGAEPGGVVGSVSSNVSTIANAFAAATSAPSLATIEFSQIAYNVNSRELTLTVSGNAAFVGDAPRLSVYLIEDSIIGTQADATTQSYLQNYVHNHVIRAAISNIWGDADAFTGTSGAYSKSYTYTLPASMNASHCRVVAFVNNNGASLLNRKVMNATQSQYLTSSTLSIAAEPSVKVVTYPNPATEMAYITAESMIRSYELIDAMGRKVASAENMNANILELNVSGLAAGVYFVSVTTDNGVSTERLSVVK